MNFREKFYVGARGLRMDLKSCNMTMGMSQSTTRGERRLRKGGDESKYSKGITRDRESMAIGEVSSFE